MLDLYSETGTMHCVKRKLLPACAIPLMVSVASIFTNVATRWLSFKCKSYKIDAKFIISYTVLFNSFELCRFVPTHRVCARLTVTEATSGKISGWNKNTFFENMFIHAY